jgi:phage terminase large subunit-like protein
MARKDKENIREYEEYFAGILAELEKEFAKTEIYSKTTDEEIKKFEGAIGSKGGQHYLVEHIKNAINLQAQRQSIIKDKFAIKKAVLDYAMKNDLSEAEGKSLFDEINRLVEIEKQRIAELGQKVEKTVSEQQDEEALDDIISGLFKDKK